VINLYREYDLNRFRYREEQWIDLTYILGARCKDGVVLIGDRKVTLEGGTDFEYSDKIFMDIPPIIVGSSGVAGLFDKFRRQVAKYVTTHREDRDIDNFIAAIEDITRDLNVRYRERLRGNYFDVLIGILTADIGAYLQYINPIGFAEAVRKYKVIGHGEPYGSIYLKQLWKQDMTMEQTAELGYFIIRHIEKLELDGSVGGTPQIWFIPDPPKGQVSEEDKPKYVVRQADQTTIDAFEKRIDDKISKYKESLKQLSP